MRLHAASTDDLLARVLLAAGAAGAAEKDDFRVRGFGVVATFSVVDAILLHRLVIGRLCLMRRVIVWRSAECGAKSQVK